MDKLLVEQVHDVQAGVDVAMPHHALAVVVGTTSHSVNLLSLPVKHLKHGLSFWLQLLQSIDV